MIAIENLDLLEQALAGGRGVVLLLSHMGNWELLSRIIHFFPKDSKAGAFYRPLNNRLLDERVLARRQADGTRMFSKHDAFHQVASFLRERGIVGILADQRVGGHGELVRFFGRLTRASPLPSLLARRSKSSVLALSRHHGETRKVAGGLHPGRAARDHGALHGRPRKSDESGALRCLLVSGSMESLYPPKDFHPELAGPRVGWRRETSPGAGLARGCTGFLADLRGMAASGRRL